jgi:hypothetical protein
MEVRALRKPPGRRAFEVDDDAALVAAAREEPRMFLALYDRYFDRVLGLRSAADSRRRDV